MAKQTIDRGTAANDGTGDSLRIGAGKVNDNFDEIYNAIGDGSTLISGTIVSDISTATFSNKTIDSANNTLTVDLSEATVTGTTAEFNTALSDNDFATLAGSETLTNKTINGPDNTLTNIPNSALDTIQNSKLANSSFSIIADDSSAQSISLGGSILFTGGSGITTSISGNEITFDTDGSIVTETSTDTLTNKSIDATTNTLSNITNSELSGSAGITNANLANSSVTLIDDSSTTDAVSLGETLRFTGGTGITSTVGTNEVTFDIDNTVATLTGTQELTNKTINASSNTLSNIVNANLSGSAAISNANLANPNVTIGADTISLGGTQTTITDLDLDGSSSLSGTGTIDITGSGNLIRFDVSYADATALDAGINSTTYEGAFVYNTNESRPYVADSAGWTKLITENQGVGDLSNVNLSGISSNKIMVWDSGDGRFEPVSGSYAPWQEKTNSDSPYTAVAGERIFVDCSGGTVTINLPASPSVGDHVQIVDASGDSGSNAITIGRNGSNLMGGTSDSGISVNGGFKEFVYYNATRGWIIINQA